ncbi:MAG: hypothetical protein ACF8LL_04055 [Phycisphaerales bacterium]
MTRSTIGLLLCILTLLAMLGCSSTGKVDISKLPDPPSTKTLVDRHNERLEPLDTLWARVSVRAKGSYDDGTTYEEQGEGHLQIVRPDRISLSIGKLGETYFVFGASESRYWSFNLADADRKVMLTGAMDKVTRGKAAALGLPVHPSELIPLSGLSRIELAQAGGTRWREDGKAFGFTTPASWGTTATWFDPSTRLVVQTQAFDEYGELIATAELSRYKDASIPGQSPVQVPGKIEITTPNDDGFVRIETSGPEARDIRSMVFQPERLQRRYRVDEVIDLDEPADDSTPQEQTTAP